jgi:segregation and condensation protein A
MEGPVYHIPALVQTKGKGPEDFVGPLDLILSLLAKRKIAIRDLSLTDLLTQYLAWVDQRQALDLEVAGEFTAMAAHLMLLKTRTLLAQEEEETQSQWEALMESLEARALEQKMAQVRAVLPQMDQAYRQGRRACPKPPEPGKDKRSYRYAHCPEDLTQALARWQKRQRQARPPAPGSFAAVLRQEPYGVEEKTRQVLARLRQEGPLPMASLLGKSRSEATAAFLSLLELCRRGAVRLEGPMDDPTVSLRAGAEAGERAQGSKLE